VSLLLRSIKKDSACPEKPAKLKSSNNATRKKIIASARKLFYRQGYCQTTLSQICEDSKVNLGLITYYFGSKASLACEISNCFMLDLRNEIASQLSDVDRNYSMALGVAVECRVLICKLMEDENLLRYFTESWKDAWPFSERDGETDQYYQLQRKHINPELADSELAFYQVCSKSIMQSLLEAFCCGFFTCEPDTVSEYCLRMMFLMMQLPCYQSEAILQKSGHLQRAVSFKVGSTFEITAETLALA
jgi:AcrR family transcriptional regulator